MGISQILMPATTAGETPLMRAAGLGERKAVDDLLAAGADPILKDNRGFTAADYAIGKQIGLNLSNVPSSREIVRLLGQSDHGRVSNAVERK
jgi:ankyrin repeat protein